MGSFARATTPSSRSPSFFKVMVGDFSKDLRIPSAFVKHFDGVVPHKSKIMRSTPDGKVWCVYVQKMDQCFFFQKGWREFVEENFIELGDFLVFHYVGDSKFEVVIYGKHCCEKELSADTASRDEPYLKGNTLQDKAKGENWQRGIDKSRTDEIKGKRNEAIHIKSDDSSCDDMGTDSDGSSTDADESDTKEHRRQEGNETKCKPSKLKEKTEDGLLSVGVRTPCLGRLSRKVKARALKAASKFVSNYPFFKVVMQSTYLHSRCLRIPKKFSSIHLKRSRKAKLLASDRFWPVNVLVYKNCGVLTGGWSDFVNDNALGAGDVCVFEMLESNQEAVLKVSLFRCLAPLPDQYILF